MKWCIEEVRSDGRNYCRQNSTPRYLASKRYHPISEPGVLPAVLYPAWPDHELHRTRLPDRIRRCDLFHQLVRSRCSKDTLRRPCRSASCRALQSASPDKSYPVKLLFGKCFADVSSERIGSGQAHRGIMSKNSRSAHGHLVSLGGQRYSITGPLHRLLRAGNLSRRLTGAVRPSHSHALALYISSGFP